MLVETEPASDQLPPPPPPLLFKAALFRPARAPEVIVLDPELEFDPDRVTEIWELMALLMLEEELALAEEDPPAPAPPPLPPPYPPWP
jgi:hypothetical protein